MKRRLVAVLLMGIGVDGTSLAAPTKGRNARQISQIATCPITTVPDSPFAPPEPYPALAPPGTFWYGTQDLWTALPIDGSWQGLRQKVFWWHLGFDGRTEHKPQLTVAGRRLDGAGSFVRAPPATNASNAGFGGWTILALVDIPTTGCWEITGSYRGGMIRFNVSIVP